MKIASISVVLGLAVFSVQFASSTECPEPSARLKEQIRRIAEDRYEGRITDDQARDAMRAIVPEGCLSHPVPIPEGVVSYVPGDEG